MESRTRGNAGARPQAAEFFLGVDQTGAVDSKGRPKPLPFSLLMVAPKSQTLHAGWLKDLQPRAIESAFLNLGISLTDYHLLTVFVDCVIGLPAVFNSTYREELLFTHETAGFGRRASEEHFEKIRLRKPQLTLPIREVEVLAKANSVFLTRPFQKNVQTGTFRLWKNLASDPCWYFVPYLEEPRPSCAELHEAFPSLLWRSVFGSPTRRPTELLRMIEQQFPEVEVTGEASRLINQSADIADAAVLAVGGHHLLRTVEYSYPKNPAVKSEGWILGV